MIIVDTSINTGIKNKEILGLYINYYLTLIRIYTFGHKLINLDKIKNH